MNVFHRYTRASLLNNKARTWVTLIGIVLSVALFTAVTEGAYSGVQFMVRTAQQKTGAFHGYDDGLTTAERQELSRTDGVRRTTAWQQVGWAQIGSENPDKPYLLIHAVEEGFEELVSVRLLAGRMPQTAQEILLPEHLNTNGGVSIAVGEEITLEVGRRVDSTAAELSGDDAHLGTEETLTETKPRTYTVVGIYQRFDYLVEPYHCPGYTALTGAGGEGLHRAFFTLQRPRLFYEWADTHNPECTANKDLLTYYGATGYVNINQMIYGLMAVLMFLIFFGSVSLIYNSFSISVSERTRQFGILKSVGATKRQIRRSVMYEALVLCAIAIPLGLVVGCAGIGITLYCLRDSFSFVVGYAIYADADPSAVEMHLVLHPLALLGAAGVGLITALVSAWVPARRAVAVSAIDAIRQTNDVAVRGRDVRISRLTGRLFGFAGMLAAKNFKRNRRRYRATVMSLFLSVTLFISSSSFCAYLTEAASDVGGRESQVDLSYYTAGDTPEQRGDAAQIAALIASADSVEEVVAYERTYEELYFPREAVSQEWQKLPLLQFEGTGDTLMEEAAIVFVDDALFARLAREAGVEPGADDAPGALVWDYAIATAYRYNEEGEREAISESAWMFTPKAFPITAEYQRWKELEGYVTLQETREENGRTMCLYYPLSHMEQVWSGTAEMDAAQSTAVPWEEAVVSTELKLTARLDEQPFFLTGYSARLTLVYPMSRQLSVIDERIYTTEFAIRAADHRTAYADVSRLLALEGLDRSRLHDQAEDQEVVRAMVRVVNVFSYGFIILISLIAMANVFNTISTNIALRRREFAMLKSMGLSQRGFRRMMNYECLIYGARGLMWGLPASAVMTFVIYLIVGVGFNIDFYLPWYSVAIAVGSVFVVVFATMLYATARIRKENPIDVLKTENL